MQHILCCILSHPYSSPSSLRNPLILPQPRSSISSHLIHIIDFTHLFSFHPLSLIYSRFFIQIIHLSLSLLASSTYSRCIHHPPLLPPPIAPILLQSPHLASSTQINCIHLSSPNVLCMWSTIMICKSNGDSF